MGKRDIGGVETKTGGQEGGRGSQKNTDTSSTENRGGRGRGRGTGTTEGKLREENLGLSDVKEPKIVAVDVPNASPTPAEDKPKRGRPAGSTSKKKQPPKAKAAAAHVDHTHLSILLVTVTGIIASRPNMLPFAFTMEEANQIALPLSNILAKNEGFAAATNEYADHIALVIAAATIIIPKFLMYQAMKPQSEKRVTHGTSTNTGTEQTGTTNRDSGAANRQPSHTADVQANPAAFNGSIGNLLAPISGI